MKRILIAVGLLVVVGVGAAAYFEFGGSTEVRRERHLGKARQYITEAKVNEAVIEFKNALKADPGSAESHYELAMALAKRGEYQPAYQELLRARDLKPDLIPARFQLATLYLLNRDTKRAKEELEQIRERNKDANETH